MYNTTDFYTTALLIACGHDIQKVSKEHPSGEESPDGLIRRFYFTDSEELRKDILDFTNNKKMGSLKKFKEAIETTKDLIHS